MGIVNIQCLLRIDGMVASILAGVFFTSSFCVVPESSGSSNAASSSLFVHVELGTRTAVVQLIALGQQCTASFKDLYTIGVASFPGLPPFFVLRFSFSIMHKRGRARKTGKAWDHLSRE